MSLKNKTISGLKWSFIDIIAKNVIRFIIGIILARLLSPKEFGLIGMTIIFIVLSESFIDSGFGQALVRKKDCTQADYSTVFFYNLIIGLMLFSGLFLSSRLIADFFNEPKLELILKVLSTGIIIRSITIIHDIIIIKRIDFRLKTKISIIASLGSGIFGIYFAYRGLGVWSLVIKTLSMFALTSIFLWILNKWKPTLVFSWQSFKELFSFGYKLLLSRLIKRIYDNIFSIVIAKFYSAEDLGFYTRANQFKHLSADTLTVVIQRVSFPILSTIQDDLQRLKLTIKILLKSTMLLTFFFMLWLAVIAKPLILFLIGEVWLPAVILLQLLCFVGIFHPLQELNQSILKIQGRSDIILRLELLKKILIVPVIFLGIFGGIKLLLAGMIFISFISFLLDSFYAGKQINYKMLEQIKDIMPAFSLCSLAGVLTYWVGFFINNVSLINLLIQSFVYVVIVIATCELSKISEYVFIKQIVIEKIRERKNEK